MAGGLPQIWVSWVNRARLISQPQFLKFHEMEIKSNNVFIIYIFILTPESASAHLVSLYTCFRYSLTISTRPIIDIKVTLFQCILLRIIPFARMFRLIQSEERKNSAKPQSWTSMSRKVSLVNGQTERLALPTYPKIVELVPK
jgi:hypothetical protein